MCACERVRVLVCVLAGWLYVVASLIKVVAGHSSNVVAGSPTWSPAAMSVLVRARRAGVARGGLLRRDRVKWSGGGVVVCVARVLRWMPP